MDRSILITGCSSGIGYDAAHGLKSIVLNNNFSFGIKEHIIFPEVNFDKVDKIRGLDVTIVTSSKSKQGTLELLKEFNFPLNEKKTKDTNG